MRQSSSTSERAEPGPGLFGHVFTTGAAYEATSDAAWLQAMLDAEAALARAQARTGLINSAAAAAIAASCDAGLYDADELGEAAALSGNPVTPLVRALTERVAAAGGSGAAERYVHLGATSQDILDTAMMLVSSHALDAVLADVDAVAGACADLAETHRDTVLAGRTLLQQALPVTFGLKAAGWLAGVDDARRRLAQVRAERLAAQLGGAAGTLASLGDEGAAVARAFADELGLAEPVLPWHTVRVRLGELAGALGVLGGVLGKVARDVTLLAQTEIGEVAEPAAAGRGGSSTMPHKRNPVGSTSALACVHRIPGLVATLLGAMVQEHERAAGTWHAEWETLRDLLRLSAGAAASVRDVVSELEVRTDRMRGGLDATGGLLLAERVTTALAGGIGRLAAHDLVEAACRRAVEHSRPLRDVLLEEPPVREHLSAAEVDAALDPTRYLGSAREFVDRALAGHRTGAGRAAP